MEVMAKSMRTWHLDRSRSGRAVSVPAAARAKGEAGLAFWQRLRMSRAHRDLATATTGISDLRLAASFVKSIETEDWSVNEEIKRVARQIEHIAESLDDHVKSQNRVLGP